MNKGKCCCLQEWHVFISCLSSFIWNIIIWICYNQEVAWESCVERGGYDLVPLFLCWSDPITFFSVYTSAVPFSAILRIARGSFVFFSWISSFLFNNLLARDTIVLFLVGFFAEIFRVGYWNLKWKVVKGERRLIDRFDLLCVLHLHDSVAFAFK